MLDRPVVKALEVLRTVFDAVKEVGLTPEDFFERPSAELRGMSPRTYLAQRPLVHNEPRLAARAALREFVAELSSRPVPDVGPAGTAQGGQTDDARVQAPTTTMSKEPQGERQPQLSLAPDHPSTDDRGRDKERRGFAAMAAQEPVSLVKAGQRPVPAPIRQELPPADTVNHGSVRAVAAEQQPVRGDAEAEERTTGAEAGSGSTPPATEGQAEDAVGRHPVPVHERTAGRQYEPPHEACGQEPAHEEADRQSGPVATAAEGGPMLTRADTVRQLVQLQAKADQQLAQALAEAEEERARLSAEVEQHLDDARREHEAELTHAWDQHRRRLAEERSAGDARMAAAREDAERRLDALEEALLRRTDRSLLRKEQHLRAQAEERIARIEDGHREAHQALAERAEYAEQRERSARTALAAAGERGTRAEQRAKDAEQRANDAEHRASRAEERAAVLYQRANEAQRRAEETAQRLRRYREEGRPASRAWSSGCGRPRSCSPSATRLYRPPSSRRRPRWRQPSSGPRHGSLRSSTTPGPASPS